MRPCPFCAEEIQDKAVVCRFCNRQVGEPARVNSPTDTLSYALTQHGQSLRDGQVLAGQYQVVGDTPLATGGMGEVWKAVDSELNTPVAVKVLPAVVCRDKVAVEALRREAAIGRQLSHPGICRIFGLHAEGDVRFIVMEYVEGQTLAAYLASRPEKRLNWEQLEPLARQLAEALDYAHGISYSDANGRAVKGILHRDIKPQNIMVTASGQAKLLDFGIAREIHNTMTQMTGRTSQTPLYASPEQFRGEPLTAASDIYSFTAVLYECLAGHSLVMPHGDIGYQILQKSVEPLVSVPQGVNAMLAAGLNRNGKERPGQATRLLATHGEAVRKEQESRQQREEAEARRLRQEQEAQARRERETAASKAREQAEAERRQREESAAAAREREQAEAERRQREEAENRRRLADEQRRRSLKRTIVALVAVLLLVAAGVFVAVSIEMEQNRRHRANFPPNPESSQTSSHEAVGNSPASISDTPSVAQLTRQINANLVQQQPAPSRIGETITNSIGMKLTYIPACSEGFLMGSEIPAEEVMKRFGADKADYFTDEHPQHRVRLTKSYLLGVHAVTRGEFGRFVREANYKTTAEEKGTGWGWSKEGYKEQAGLTWRNPGFEQTDEHPVVLVSHDDAMAFCKWLSDKEGKKYRLPTEAEWEYACRAGTKTIFFWGDQIEDGKRFANMCDEAANNWSNATVQTGFMYYVKWNDGFANTSPVGSFQANPWGLQDMLGDVFQWCSDWYGSYSDGEQTDPSGPGNGASRVLRGGSWNRTPAFCRPALRGISLPDGRICHAGFRLALDF